MMLGVSGLMGSSGDGAAAAEAHESGGASGGSSEVGASSSIPGGGGGMEESERSGGGGGGGGNRWPRQETLALLKIRSEMDVTFRDSSLKGPLWEEVSRKMAELGFQRNPKKCKEKFENVYKYHKRTKDGRSSKSDGAGGKTYRFFDQLEALENTTTTPPPPHLFTTAAAPPPPRPPPLMLTSSTAAAAAALPMPPTVSSSNVIPANINNNPIINSSSFQPSSGQPPPLQHHLPPPPQPPPSSNTIIPPQGHAFQHSGGRPHMMPTRQLSDSTSNSSTSSDEDIQRRRRGRKRKWKDFFERVMKDVINKQEDLQKRFLDTLEKRERDRTAREDAWRLQEITRLNREHDLLVQERSIAAAKDAAVISFLQKVTDQHNLQIPIANIFTAPPPPPPQVPPVQIQPPQIPQPPRQQQPPSMQLSTIPPQPQPPAAPPTTKPAVAAPPAKIMDIVIADNGGGGDNSMSSASSSRWPKAEVEALIKLRTNLDIKYQENGPKGPLWEEISSAMAKIGYNRSSKRCKEKWENINKYFKKVKESNKKRPEDSKTCPYFHQLDAIYRERGSKTDVVSFPGYGLNPDNNPMMLPPPIMARPEQQWPLPPDEQRQQTDQFQDNESDHDEEEDDGDGDEDDEEDEAQCFEIVTNKQQSSVTTTTNAAD
ncbi:hypothetical protein ABFX02_14G309900 [Erythranthe guttata]